MARASAKSDSGSGEPVDNGPSEFVAENGDNGNESGNIIDPGSIEYGDDYERDEFGQLVIGTSGKPRRKRGRKSGGNYSGSGGGSAGSAKPSKGNNQALISGIETLSQTLLIVHMGIAKFTECKHFELEKKESDNLAGALVNVMEQFDITPDPKWTAVTGLITTSAMIYGPRIVLYRLEAEDKRKAKRAQKEPLNSGQFDGNNIVDMGGFNLGG